MYNLESAKIIVYTPDIYLIVIDDDHVHGVGKELWYQSPECPLKLIGISAIGCPTNIPVEVSDSFHQDITPEEWQAWKDINPT